MATQALPVWHPSVHSSYDEKLRFLGVEVASYHNALSYLRKEFHETASVYEVYGSKDMLVRIYANEAEYLRIKELIRDNVGKLSSIFTVDSILYYWGYEIAGDLPKRVLTHYDTASLRLAAEPWDEEISEVRAALMKDHVIVGSAEEGEEGESVRVFIFVGAAQMDLELEMAVLKELKELEEIAPYIHGLYVGTHTDQGSILLELSIPKRSFEAIIRAVRGIHYLLRHNHPRTTTYIAADVTREKIDRCSFQESFSQLASRWEDRFPAIGPMKLGQKLFIVDLCQRWSTRLAETLTRNHAHSMIEALIEFQDGKSEKTKNAIAQLSEQVERLLGDIIMYTARDKWGRDDWKRALKEDLGFPKPFAEWSFGELFDACRRWADRLNEDLLESAVLAKLQDLVELRNAVVHPQTKKGKKSFKDYSEDDIVAIVTDTFSVMATLRSTLDTRIRTD